MTEPDREKIDARVGTTLAGKYQLLRVLGVGGMGAVYEAENSWTERRVAIKVVLAELTKNKDVASRFLREARSASKIAHPNIVDVLDMGQDADDGSLYIVQEFLDGSDLRHLLDRRTTLRPGEALEIITPIASALIAAHRRGIIHRDIKPENIFLVKNASGGVVPKLIDFGIAKMNDVAGEATTLTRTGAAMGTPYTMSPEQARGDREIDGQTDVWALGVVLFEMLSGRCPFEADSYNALLAQILMNDAPRLDSVAPSVPRALADVVVTALQRDRTKRFRNVQALLGALLDCAPLRDEQWHQRLRISHLDAAQDDSETIPVPDDSGIPTPEYTPARASSDFDDEETSLVGGTGVVGTSEALRMLRAPGPTPRMSSTTFGQTARQITAPKPERRPHLTLGLAAFLVAAGSVGLVLRMRSRESAVAATARPSVVAARPAETFTATFDVEPPGSTIEIDGIPAGSGHVARTLPVDGRTHAARFSAPGYAERRMLFVDTLPPTHITLDPIVAVPAPRPGTATRRGQPTVVPARPASPPAAIASPAPASARPAPANAAPARATTTPAPARNGAPVLGLD